MLGEATVVQCLSRTSDQGNKTSLSPILGGDTDHLHPLGKVVSARLHYEVTRFPFETHKCCGEAVWGWAGRASIPGLLQHPEVRAALQACALAPCRCLLVASAMRPRGDSLSSVFTQSAPGDKHTRSG